MRPIIKAGLVGLAAWALWPRSRNEGAGLGASQEGTDWDKVYLTGCVGDAASVVVDGKPYYVLSDGQPDPISLTQEKANLEQGQAMQGASPDFYQLFKRQVEDPAGRVKCSDVQPYHFQLAQGIITGQLPRGDKRGRLYVRVLEQIAQNKKNADDLAIAQQVINGVAAFIPVIGGAIKIAVGTGIGEGIKGAAQNALNESEALQAIDEIAGSMGANSPEGRMWLSNEDSSKPPDPALVHGTDVYTVGLSSMGGYYRRDADGKPVFPAEAVRYVKVTKNGSTYQEYTVQAGYTFVPVGGFLRLFAMHQYGWILAWLSPLLGCDDTLERQIAITAPVVRAFDIVRTKTFPIAPTGKRHPFRYWYVNPKHGLMMGSCLPPTSEDSRYNDGLRHYDFDGTDISEAVINRNSTIDLRADAVKTGANIYMGSTSTPAPTASAPSEDYGQAAAVSAAQQSVAVSTTTVASTTTRIKGVR